MEKSFSNHKPLIDSDIADSYSKGGERDRLQFFRLEKERTLQLLKKHLPSPPAVILDVGGGAGAYAFPLTERGYEVHLVDPIPLHLEQAKENLLAIASYTLGDARKLDREDHSVDAVLLLGPLYHLIEATDRTQALKEAHRVLKPGGILLAAAISKYASFMDAFYKGELSRKWDIIDHELETGIHKKASQNINFSYLHHPFELKREVEALFQSVQVCAIEGPVTSKEALDKVLPEEWEKLLSILESLETEETLLGASAHLMAIGYKS